MQLIRVFVSFLFIFIRGTEEKQALIFDRFTRSFFQLPSDIPEDLKIGAWAVACPAETPEELDFTRENSFTKNGMFVKEIYQRGDKATEVKKDVCKEPFKISLVFNVKSLTFQIGFEIYYDLTDANYFHINNSEDYKSVTEFTSSMSRLRSQAKFFGKEIFRVAKNAIGSDLKELWLNRNKRMGFAWIYLLKFKFDFSKKIVTKMMYYIGPDSRWPNSAGKCLDDNLGDELLKDVDYSVYFRTEETIARKFSLPKKITCKSNEQCFQSWSIVPTSQLHFNTSDFPLCSKIALIPVWKIINLPFLLERIDRYLYFLYRVVKEPLHIIAGTVNEMELSKRRGLGKSTVFLDPAKQILPVPQIIYKVVEYRMKDCKLEEKFCWYSAVIVIHNDPLFGTSGERLCPEKKTRGWGWEELLETTSEYVYVCPRNEFVKWKLFGITVYQTSKGRSAHLKLSSFPFSDDGETPKPKDIREDIRLMFNAVSKNEYKFDVGANKVIEITQKTTFNPEDEDWELQNAAAAAKKEDEE